MLRVMLFLIIFQGKFSVVSVVFDIKGTVMQIEKALINYLVRFLKVSWEFRIPTVMILQ